MEAFVYLNITDAVPINQMNLKYGKRFLFKGIGNIVAKNSTLKKIILDKADFTFVPVQYFSERSDISKALT